MSTTPATTDLRSTVVTPLSGSMIAPRDLVSYVARRLEGDMLDSDVSHGRATLTVTPEAWRGAVRMCKLDPALDCAFFDFLTAIDMRDDGFAVICSLYSVRHGHHVQLRSMVAGGRDEPNHPSIADVYGGANWHERETFDMFGIAFDGHPGLEPRILTTEGFEGWPLRKDFLLTTREVKPWPGNKEPKAPDEVEDGEGDGSAKPSGPTAEEKAKAAKEKAERAKRKAAEMRKKKAAERAAARGETEEAPSPEETPTSDGAVPERSTPADHAEESGADVRAQGAGAQTGGPEGQPAEPSGTPGVEAEGRHGGAVEQSGDTSAAQTPGTGAPEGASELGADDPDDERDDDETQEST